MSESSPSTEFVSIDPSARETISGKSLMLGAYGVIIGLLLLYAVLLALRSSATKRAIRRLEHRLKPSTKSSEKN